MLRAIVVAVALLAVGCRHHEPCNGLSECSPCCPAWAYCTEIGCVSYDADAPVDMGADH